MVTPNKILIAVVATAAALAAFWYFALAPQREQAAKLKADISAKQGEVATAKSSLAGYEQSRANYKSNYATLVRLGKAVPEDDEVRSLMVQLDDASRGTGVDFRTIQVGGSGGAAPSTSSSTGTGTSAQSPPPGAVAVGNAGFSAMPFTFSFNGNFFNLTRFFTRLEHFVTERNQQLNVTGRLLRLENIDLQVGQGGFPQIKAQIGASSYIVPPTQSVTAGATPQAPAAATPAPSSGPSAPTTPATATGATP
jgi:hypothetical protein